MRRLTVTALLAAGFALALAARADDPPTPILKPAAPAGGQLRVRLPLVGGDKKVLQFTTKGQVPKGKSKKADAVEITVSLGTTGRSAATGKMLRSWGYDVPDGTKAFTLPELTLFGSQTAPKPTKGTDAAARFTAIKLDVMDEDILKSDQIMGTDLYFALPEVLKTGMEPRLYFADHVFDLNLSPAAMKRPGTGDDLPPDPPSKASAKLTVFSAPLTAKLNPIFTHATINGMDMLKLPNGPVPLQVLLSSSQWMDPGLLLGMGAARPLGLEVDTTKGQYVESKLRELRLGVQVGAGYKTAKDFVLTDLPVVVDTLDSGPSVSIGTNFISKHFPDAVYTAEADGSQKLYGRVKGEELAEPKTRGKK